MSDILVVALLDGAAVNDVSLQCLVEGRKLADASGGKVDALAIGSGSAAAAAGLFGYGADAVFAADDAALESYVTSAYAAALKGFLAENSYDVVLLPGTTSGDDLAPYVATQLGGSAVVGADRKR